MEDALDKITMDDLEDEQKQLANTIGMEGYINLTRNYGGTYIYIQKSETFEKKLRNDKIRSEFNGYNFKELAHRYGLTEIRIRSIVKDIYDKKKNIVADGQLTLFDN